MRTFCFCLSLPGCHHVALPARTCGVPYRSAGRAGSAMGTSPEGPGWRQCPQCQGSPAAGSEPCQGARPSLSLSEAGFHYGAQAGLELAAVFLPPRSLGHRCATQPACVLQGEATIRPPNNSQEPAVVCTPGTGRCHNSMPQEQKFPDLHTPPHPAIWVLITLLGRNQCPIATPQEVAYLTRPCSAGCPLPLAPLS